MAIWPGPLFSSSRVFCIDTNAPASLFRSYSRALDNSSRLDGFTGFARRTAEIFTGFVGDFLTG